MKVTKVRTQLISAFALVLVLMVSSIGFGISRMAQVQHRLDDITNDNFKKVTSINSLLNTSHEEGMVVQGIGIAPDEATRTQMKQRLKASRDFYDVSVAELEELIRTPEDQEFITKLKGLQKSARAANDQIFKLGMDNQTAEAQKLFWANSNTIIRDWWLVMYDFSDQQATQLDAAYQEAKGAYTSAVTWMIALGVVATLISVALGVLISRSILGKLGCEPSEAAQYMRRIAAGDLAITLNATGKHPDSLVIAFKRMMDAIKSLVEDAEELVAAAVQGNLATRVDASKHEGEYQKIIQGVNDTLDAVIGPLNVAAQCVDDLSKGIIPPQITGEFQGDFNTLKNNLNQALAAINTLVSDTDLLLGAATEGNLDTRANAEHHQGEFRKIIEGVNNTLDAVIGPLNVAAQCVDDLSKGIIPSKISGEFKGDFNALKNNLNQALASIDALVSDTDLLLGAAMDGNLETRADANQHQGVFRKIINGIDLTLDAITTPLNEVARVLDALSENDLTEKMQGDYRGTFARLRDDVNLSLEQLSQRVIVIKQSADAVSEASRQIVSGNQDLAQRTEQQASSLRTTTASMEELASTVKRNADHAEEANQMAKAASDLAAKGGVAVRQVIGTMSNIHQSSRKVAEISSLIDGIAFQTNILAINAAVEAARAGEQGRGFAVVATEVRNLAKRSATASKEIGALITESVRGIENGSEQVNQAGATMDEIVASVQQVSSLMTSIAADTSAQRIGIDQVNQAIIQIEGGNRQNAALVNREAAAAESLEQESQNLAEAVDVFRLGDAAPVVGGFDKPNVLLPHIAHP